MKKVITPEESRPKYITQEEFDALHVVGADFSDCDLRGCRLSGDFVGVSFSGADLEGVNMSSAVFNKCDFTGSTLTAADLNYSEFELCEFNDCEMGYINATSASFWRCNFENSGLYCSSAHKANFYYCTFHLTDFTDADLTETDLTGSDFKDACLCGVITDNIRSIACNGDGRYIKNLRVARIDVTYTHNMLCVCWQQRSISDWKKDPRVDASIDTDDDFIHKVLMIVEMFPAKRSVQV